MSGLSPEATPRQRVHSRGVSDHGFACWSMDADGRSCRFCLYCCTLHRGPRSTPPRTGAAPPAAVSKGASGSRCERARESNDTSLGSRPGAGGRHDRERKRRKDAKADGVVAGVIGTVMIGGIIAAATSGKKKPKDNRSNRRDYCMDRYGSYDERSDSYRASDGH